MTEDAHRPIDLQFNYPVLPGQQQDFSRLLQQTAQGQSELLPHQPYGGRNDDREIAAGWLSQAGQAFDPARVLLCAGGHHGVFVTLLAAGLSRKKIAVDPLTYPGFKMQAAALGIEVLPCAGDADGMLPQSLAEAAQKGAAAVFLMPTVHNPLGTVMPETRRREICAVARAHDLWIIDDDAYQFCEQDPPPSFAALAPALAFSIWSFTKPVAPALNLAYLAVPEKLVAATTTALRITSSGVSAVLAQIASSMVKDGSLRQLLAAKRVEGAKRQKMAASLFEGIEMRAHPSSFHVWLELPQQKDATTVTNQLHADGILVNSWSDFAANAEVLANGMRVALGAEPNDARRTSALERVRQRVLE